MDRPTGARRLPHPRGGPPNEQSAEPNAPTPHAWASQLATPFVGHRRGHPAHMAPNGRPTHAVPHRDERSHRRPADRAPLARARAAAPSLAGVALVLGIGVALRWVALSDTPEATDREAALVTGVVTLSRTGVWTGLPLGAVPARLLSLATPQLAAIGSLTGAWRRVPSALGAVRECGPLLWTGAALLVWVLARRLGVVRRWALLAVALLAICPAAIGAARVAAPENLALLWSLAALVLVTGRHRVGRAALGIDLVIIGCTSVAVLTAPVALALLPTVLLLSAVQRDPRRPALIAVGVLLTVGVGTAFTVVAAPSGGSPGWLAPGWLATGGPVPDWLGPGWLGRDLVTPALVLLVGLLALRPGGRSSPRRRALAVGVLGVPLLALPLGAAPTPALPLAAVLVAAAAAGIERDLLARSRPARRYSPPDRRERPNRGGRPERFEPPERGEPPDRRAGRDRGAGRFVPQLAPALLIGVLAVVWAANLAELPTATAPPPAAAARAWLRDNVPDTDQVRTDDRTRVALVPGTEAWSRVSTGDTPSAPAWWVSAPGDRPPATAALVAEFGASGAPDRLEISGALGTAPDPARELAARRAAGAMLTMSPQLSADPGVLDQLRAGRVDPCAMTALAGLLSRQRIRLVDLPPMPGETAADRPLRQLLLAPDGPPPEGVPDTGPDTARRAVVEFFEAQLAPFRPYAVTETPAGVLVRYSPLAPPDLLEAFLAR
ncbi:MAG TPA: hypothetical protein VNP03_10485 [Pseudonocardia sp.]|nr:hypothetical protein [Pseudonocardia sp.]